MSDMQQEEDEEDLSPGHLSNKEKKHDSFNRLFNLTRNDSLPRTTFDDQDYRSSKQCEAYTETWSCGCAKDFGVIHSGRPLSTSRQDSNNAKCSDCISYEASECKRDKWHWDFCERCKIKAARKKSELPGENDIGRRDSGGRAWGVTAEEGGSSSQGPEVGGQAEEMEKLEGRKERERRMKEAKKWNTCDETARWSD